MDRGGDRVGEDRIAGPLVSARPFTDDGPADPDRSWAWRDSGDGAEHLNVDDGPFDDEASYVHALRHCPVAVTPIFRQENRP